MKRNESFDFLSSLSIDQIIEVFDLLPDTVFWIKDPDSKILYANKEFLEQHGSTQLEQVLGKNDYQLFPHYIAQQFITDDQSVMKGQKITNRMELNITATNDFAWYSTTKRCLTNNKGIIIGTYGFTRHLSKTSKAESYMSELKEPINYIKENYQNCFSIDELAEVSHLSVSALERRFKKHLGKTPKQFINEFRLEQAKKLLIETNLPVADIGFQVGFSDPSYFSKMFKQLFTILPSELRAANNQTN